MMATKFISKGKGKNVKRIPVSKRKGVPKSRFNIKTIKTKSNYRIPNIGKSRKPDSFFDKKQLRIGTMIEMEHTDDPKIAKEIAKDHLEESPRYYIELQKLERKLKKNKILPNDPPKFRTDDEPFEVSHIESIPQKELIRMQREASGL